MLAFRLEEGDFRTASLRGLGKATLNTRRESRVTPLPRTDIQTTFLLTLASSARILAKEVDTREDGSRVPGCTWSREGQSRRSLFRADRKNRHRITAVPDVRLRAG